MEPLVSVVMSTRNNETTIAAAVRSIQWQTMTNWEMFIANDGSTDKTASILNTFASDPRITVLHKAESRGVGVRCNELVCMALGKYIARMDGDDISYPERFEKQVAYLEKHKNIDLAATAMIVIDAQDNILGMRPVPMSDSAIFSKPYARFAGMYQPTFMGSAAWFRKNPYYVTPIEDFELLYRTYKFSRFSYMSDVLVAYRETHISLRKALSARWNIAKILLKNGTLLHVGKGIPLQVALGAVDTVAITTGLDYKLLRRRARPVPAQVAERWTQIRTTCNSSQLLV